MPHALRRIAPSALPPLALLVALASCGQGSENKGWNADAATVEPPPLVRVEQVALRKVQRHIETTSYLESEHRVTVLPEVAGRLVDMRVDDGDRVEKGQVIAQLDDREARTALEQTKVQLEDRRVRLDLGKLEEEAAAARVQQARIEAARTRSELERNESIDPGLIPLKQLQEAGYAADAASEALRVAEFDSRKAALEVRAAEAAIRELEAKVEEADLRVAEHAITSPIDGVVEMVNARGGETVSAATELCTVVDDDDLVTYLRRPQRELSIVTGAQRVSFTTDAFPDRVFAAQIDMIAPVVDQASGSFRIRVRVRKEDTASLRPGMFVRASILTEAERDALMVPKTAILSDGDAAIVFAVRDGIAKRIEIERGLEEREYVECRSRGSTGLVPGDLIVVSGQQSLEDETAVEIVRETDAATAADEDDDDGAADDAAEQDGPTTSEQPSTNGSDQAEKTPSATGGEATATGNDEREHAAATENGADGEQGKSSGS